MGRKSKTMVQKKKDPFGMSVVGNAANRRGKKPASFSFLDSKKPTTDESVKERPKTGPIETKQQKLHDSIKDNERSSQVEASNTSVRMITDEVLNPSTELGDHKENNILNTPTENVPTKNSDADYIEADHKE